MNEKNGLTPNSRQKSYLKEYFEDGYKVSEMFFSDSDTFIRIKEKGDEVFYCQRTPTSCIEGKYNKAEFERRMSDFDRQMDEFNRRLDDQLNNWETSISEDLDDLFDGLSFESSTRHTDSNARHNTRKTTQPKNSQKNNRYVYYTEGSSSKGSCLGCLFWTILFLCIVCVILYGMGVIGANIIQFIVDFFKSLF